MYSMRPTTTLTECGLMCTRVSTTRHLSVHLLGLTTLTNCVFLTQLLTSTSWTQRLISHRTQQQTTRKENSMSFETHDTSAEAVERLAGGLMLDGEYGIARTLRSLASRLAVAKEALIEAKSEMRDWGPDHPAMREIDEALDTLDTDQPA